MKDDWTKAVAELCEFFVSLRKKAFDAGVTSEQFNEAILNENVIAEMAKPIVNYANRTKNLALKSLKLIASGISIITQPFSNDSFFVKGGPVKLWFGKNFTEWVLPEISETVSAFDGKLTKTQLAESMYDSAILDELGNTNPFSVSKFVAIIRDLLTKQLNGEGGTLLANGYANIFYVKLKNGRVVAVSVRRDVGDRVWFLSARGLGGCGWAAGHCAFSCGADPLIS